MGPDGDSNIPGKLPKDKGVKKGVREEVVTMTDKKGRKVSGAKKVVMGEFVVLSEDEEGDGYECSIYTSDDKDDKKKKKEEKKDEESCC